MGKPPIFDIPTSFMQSGNKIIVDNKSIDLSNTYFMSNDIIEKNKKDFSMEDNQLNINEEPNNNIQKIKYNIIDLFWLINPKLLKNELIQESEGQLAVISHNMDFGNIRLSYFNIPRQAINGHIIYRNSLIPLTNCAIYPSSIYRYLYNNQEETISCIEQLFQNTGEEWQNDRPLCTIDKKNNFSRIFIETKKSKYYFDFVDWQLKALNHCFYYAITKGFELMGINTLNR